MPGLPLSGAMLNAAPIVPSIAGELNTLQRSEPTTGQVASAFVSDVFQGNGSLQQDITRFDYNKALFQGNALSEDDWKKSDFFRSGLKYYPGITDKAAEILAQSEDDKRSREYVMGKASGWQSAAGFGAALGAGIFEPKNIASGVAAGVLTEGLGTFVPAIRRVINISRDLGKYQSLAIRGATEGGLAAALTEPSNRESAKILQKDYSMADSLLNFGLSTVLSGAAHAGIAKFKDVRAEKIPTPEVQTKEFDTALGQMVEGRKVDVDHVAQLDNAQKAIRAQESLPQLQERISNLQNETGIRPVTERPEFKNWFGESKVVDETGAPQVVYHGTTSDISVFTKSTSGDLVGYHFTNSPENASKWTTWKSEIGVKPEGQNVLPVYLSLANPANEIQLKTAIKELEKSKGAAWTREELTQNLKKKGFDGYIDPDEMIAFEPGQVKSIFNRGAFDANDPRLIDIKSLENLQIKKGTAEANSKLSTDNEPIARVYNDSAKPDNSTAYDINDSKNIDDYLEKHGHAEDQAALERSLQSIQEDIQAMRDEGILSGEQLSILDQLEKIDGDIAMNEDILRSAFLCLTRG